MVKTIKVWAVTEGPFDVQKLIDEDNYPYDLPPNGRYFVVCQVEEDNKLLEKEFWFPEEKEAYAFKHHVDSQMEAVELDVPKLTENI